MIFGTLADNQYLCRRILKITLMRSYPLAGLKTGRYEALMSQRLQNCQSSVSVPSCVTREQKQELLVDQSTGVLSGQRCLLCLQTRKGEKSHDSPASGRSAI